MTKAEFLTSESGRSFAGQMQLAGRRPTTIGTYARHISVVSRTLKKPPEDLEAADADRFLAIATQNGVSNLNAATTCVALKFFIERTLNRPWNLRQFPRVFKYRKRRSRPLTRAEIVQLLRHTRSRRYRLLFSLIYGSGLRLGEACRLKISDVDFHSYKIYIRDAKGGRHRETVLSQTLARDLRHYIRDRRPADWLFPSNRKCYEADTLFPIVRTAYAISCRSVQREFEIIRSELDLPGLVTVHSLRHSFATHLVEFSMPLFSVQRLLGHQHLSTTLGYLSSMGQPVVADFSPLDKI